MFNFMPSDIISLKKQKEATDYNQVFTINPFELGSNLPLEEIGETPLFKSKVED